MALTEPLPAELQRRAVIKSSSVLIAETDRALEMREASYPPVLYVPLDDVDGRLLRRSDHHSYCPYKGEASYYDIIDGNGTDLTAAVGTTTTPSMPSLRSKVMLRSMPTG